MRGANRRRRSRRGSGQTHRNRAEDRRKAEQAGAPAGQGSLSAWRRPVATLRITCFGYLVVLTVLLLSEQPQRWIGFRTELPDLLGAMLPAAHLLSFLVLSLLAFGARWPIPAWLVAVLLAAYAAATELLQGWVPGRTPEWLDWLQDTGGIALGAAVAWCGQRLYRGRRQAPGAEQPQIE